MAPRVGSTGEDDGYLVTLTMDMNDDASYCVVYDAARVGDGPVCTLRLPERVCSGTALHLGGRRRAAAVAHHAMSSPFELQAGDTNAIARALALLGDEWTLLLVRESLMGATRFSDFAVLPISNAVLTGRLQAMVRDGLLQREIYQQQPLRAGYVADAGGPRAVADARRHLAVGTHVVRAPHRRPARHASPRLRLRLLTRPALRALR